MLRIAFVYFSGAITPVFLRRFGFRKTTMGLGVIGGITIFISSFGCSVGTLAVFAGLFPGNQLTVAISTSFHGVHAERGSSLFRYLASSRNNVTATVSANCQSDSLCLM